VDRMFASRGGVLLEALIIGWFRTLIYVPMLREIVGNAEDIDACPRVSIPAVDYFLLDPLPQIIGKGFFNSECPIFCDARFEVQLAGKHDDDSEILRVGFCDHHPATRVALSLEIKVIGLVPLAPGDALQTEQAFILVVQPMQFFAVGIAVLTRFRI